MFKNSSFPAVLCDVVNSVVISFNLGPEERLRPTTTSKDFGSSKKLELMLNLGDSSSSLVIFWSLNNNGRFARCAFLQLLGDLSINRLAHLLLSVAFLLPIQETLQVF